MYFQEQLGFGSGFISGAVTFAQHLAWLRGNVTSLQGTVDQDRTSGERSDEDLADMIMEAKRQCNVKHRDDYEIEWFSFALTLNDLCKFLKKESSHVGCMNLVLNHAT